MIQCLVWAAVVEVECLQVWELVEWVVVEEVNHHQEPFRYLKMKWKQLHVCNS